jgi:hypothetical protein
MSSDDSDRHAAESAQEAPIPAEGERQEMESPVDSGLGSWMEAARLAWKESAAFATLLGVLLYGVGRLLADGFYEHLNTSADSAGVSTFSILEPAVLVAIIFAFVATIIMILPDVISSSADRLRKVFIGGVAVVCVGGVFSWIILGVVVTLVLLLIFVPAIVSWLRRVGPVNPRFRLTAVSGSLALLVIICVAAHVTGVHEANNVKKGKEVNLNFLGLNISSIGATRVQLKVADDSVAVKKIIANPCLLQIGAGPGDILLYDFKVHETLDIPSDKVEVVSPPDQSLRCLIAETLINNRLPGGSGPCGQWWSRRCGSASELSHLS